MGLIYLRNRSYKGENWEMEFQCYALMLSKVHSWTVLISFLQTFIQNFAGWFFFCEVLHQDWIIHFDAKRFARVLLWNRKTVNSEIAKWIRHFRVTFCLCQNESSSQGIHLKMISACRLTMRVYFIMAPRVSESNTYHRPKPDRQHMTYYTTYHSVLCRANIID